MKIVSKRLLEFVKVLGISKHKFEMMCNMSNGMVSKVSNRMSPKTILNIQAAFPQLNMNWVFTGEGEMILPVYPTSTDKEDKVEVIIDGVEYNRNDIQIWKLRNTVEQQEKRLLKQMGKTEEAKANLVVVRHLLEKALKKDE